MKRLAILLVLLSCLFVSCACAEEGEGYLAVVANPNVADRLNLRQKPDAASQSLGRFYSGTVVEVTSVQKDQEGREWARVAICSAGWEAGELRGYMLKDCLMPMNRNYEAPNLFYEADTTRSPIAVRADARNSAPQVGVTGGTVWVLGDIGDDWRYISDGETTGYVRTAQLCNKRMNIYQAFLTAKDGGEKVRVYADKEMKRPIATYCTGAVVRVTDASRPGGWAKIQGCGVIYDNDYDMDGLSIIGYVSLEELTVFVQPWEIKAQGKTGILLKDHLLVGEVDVMIPKNASVAVLAETEKDYQVVYGDANTTFEIGGFVPKEKVFVTDWPADAHGPARIGYGYLRMPQDEDGYSLGQLMRILPDAQEGDSTYWPLVELIGQIGTEYWQVRQEVYPNFYVPKAETQAIMQIALWPVDGKTREAGEWTATLNTRGLWSLQVEAGKQAGLTLKNEKWADEKTWKIDAKATEYYTVYIPEGTQVSLTGEGILHGLDGKEEFTRLGENAGDEAAVIFSGSGRVFCDLQIVDESNFYSYRITPIEGAEECYLILSDLFGGEEVRLDPSEMSEPYFDIQPGEFLEVHNCEIRVYYGNG